MKVAFRVLSFAWQNRGAIQRAYHHFVKHRVMLDELLDLSEEHPDHPMNREARSK